MESVFSCVGGGGGPFLRNFLYTLVVVGVVRQEQDGVGGVGGHVGPQVGVDGRPSREGEEESAACIEYTCVGARAGRHQSLPFHTIFGVSESRI